MESGTAERSSGRVRIAIVAPSLKWVGGQSVQADLLVRHWRNDPAVEARFVPIDPTLPRWLAWTGRIPYLRTVLRMPFYLMALWRALGEVEIAHIFSASYWSFMLAVFPAWLVARLRKRKTVINYHSAEARDHLRRWRSARAVLRRADQIVVPSRYLVEVFREFGIESRALPNFIDVDRFSYRPRRPLRPRLVCTRGFEPYYSLDVVVRAYAEVKKKFSSARLVLVGKGSREAEIRALVRDLELADVEFAGVSSRETIASAYAQADIFVNASWLDNMPVSILEAFASGTPVASTAAEGIRHLVQHERTGLLSPPGDWRALAENILRLLQEPDLALRLAQNAYHECSHYCWSAVRGQWLQVYQSTLRSLAREPARRALKRDRDSPDVAAGGERTVKGNLLD